MNKETETISRSIKDTIVNKFSNRKAISEFQTLFNKNNNNLKTFRNNECLIVENEEEKKHSQSSQNIHSLNNINYPLSHRFNGYVDQNHCMETKFEETIDQQKLQKCNRIFSQPLLHIENDMKYAERTIPAPNSNASETFNCHLNGDCNKTLTNGNSIGQNLDDESSDDGGFLARNNSKYRTIAFQHSRRFSVPNTNFPLKGSRGSSEWVDMPENDLKQLEAKFQDDLHIDVKKLASQNGLQRFVNGSRSSEIDNQKVDNFQRKDLEFDKPKAKNNFSTNSLQKPISKKSGNIGTISNRKTMNRDDSRKLFFDQTTLNKNSKMQSFFSTEVSEVVSTLRSIDGDSITDYQSYVDEDDDDETEILDVRAIKKQLEGLENLYSEAITMLKNQKFNRRNHYQHELQRKKGHRKFHGSISSIPSSSVSSRPVRNYTKKPTFFENKQNVCDYKTVSKRFQKLESHIITLARSIAQLSSEMRTQHSISEDIESLRSDVVFLKSQFNSKIASTSAHEPNTSNCHFLHDFSTNFANFTNPQKVKKLKRFFGDEPPLLRLFMRKLGYEKYANLFEKEHIGIAELPYLTEDRLQKLGLPLGPRLRLLKELQLPLSSTLCIL